MPKRGYYSILSPLALLLLWEASSRLAWIDTRFFPAPSIILHYLVTDAIQLGIQNDIAISLWRIAIGYVTGCLAGVVIGIAMGLSVVSRGLFYPVITLFYPLPKIAIFPLIMLIFGLGELSKILLIAMGCFFLVALNALKGVDNINKIYFDIAYVHNISLKRRVLHIVLPGALPSIFTGLRLALGYSFVIMVAAEFSGANNGLGYWIWQAWETFSLKAMYAGIFVIAVLGWLSTFVVDRLERRFLPWARRTDVF